MGLLSRILEDEKLVFENPPLPSLKVGEGVLFSIPEYLRRQGFSRVALITGGDSYSAGGYREQFEEQLRAAGIEAPHFPISGEPSPLKVDQIRDTAAELQADAVLAVGGGSVIDTAKAVAVMLHHHGSVREYLEGVGSLISKPLRHPLIAIPATSGTGAEATKNAVISEVGEHGFKKSLRNDAYVPDLAVLDPLVIKSCPYDVTAASGMDAVTQLLEAYVSTRATPFTDALALNGLQRSRWSLPASLRDGENLNARGQMAYAAYLSGVALAGAGLGVVHGLASPLGALRNIPHGVVCGTLLPAASELVVGSLLKSDTESRGLAKYSQAATVFTGSDHGNAEQNCRSLVDELYRWVEEFSLPLLSDYGFTSAELRNIADTSSVKGTPVDLTPDEIYSILNRRL
ncbi:MAG: iron-containing alcohol dehydrogenase [Spirochaetaceae bacterium]|nr:iron-containing alcohol dehydrogenase [Spirochaetaceae bacterium]MCF7947078.1 iron-containing alcohol dehydrogenase [Spirochaetia bacterium]MCF7950079.1 iron-containing alcohol dehydrogenase [Spirochaetaceae bacterium]